MSKVLTFCAFLALFVVTTTLSYKVTSNVSAAPYTQTSTK